MSNSSPDLLGGKAQPPAPDEQPVPVVLPLPLPLGKAESTDDTPTVISKNLPRPPNNDEALDGIRGRKLAHFELIDRIGVGGMAAVLRARDTQLDRIVALKILPPDVALDEENVRRFHQEARSAAKLDHENIARVFFCGEDQRLHFIAFELVEGENLRTILERRGCLPVGEALHYLLQIAAGLAHASERGVVHRDIKPSNIIITPTGRAKLVDMGLARSLEPTHDAGLTQSGVTLGTFDYISPEQALEPRDADVRSDIYSLGCTFYHMLTGRPPVPEGTAARKLHHHQHVKPRDPREVVPGLPDEVAVILDRMLAKEPRDRYQTPQELVHHLLHAARKVGDSGAVPEGVLAMEGVVPNPPRYRPVLFAALAIAAVVVLILAIGQGTSNPVHEVIVVRNTTPVRPINDKPPPQPGDKDNTPPVKPPVAVNPVEAKVVARFDVEDATAADLAKWLKDNAKADELEIVLTRDLDLSPSLGNDANDLRLVFKAKKVLIRAKDAERPVTVRLTYPGTAFNASRPAFSIDSKDATIEGLCFLLDAREADVEMIGLYCAPGGDYRVNQCQFIQANALKDQTKDLASVVVDGAAGLGPTRVVLRQCCFLGFGSSTSSDLLKLSNPEQGGYEAVVRRGAAHLEVVDCAFGPHASIFRLEGKPGESTLTANEDVLVRHCSVLAGKHSKVFSLADDAAAALRVEYSIFCHFSDVDAEQPDLSPLVRKGNPSSLTYDDRDNRYHGIDTASSGVDITKTSRVLDAIPWKEEQPLQKLDPMAFAEAAAKPETVEHPLSLQRQEQIAAAFQLNWQEHLADVQPTDQPRHLIGVERLPTSAGNYVAKLPKEIVGPLALKERVVDPKAKMSRDGVYPTLKEAFAAAAPGDKILIKHDGELAIGPLRQEDPLADLTILPYPNFHPILTLESSTDPEAFLFRVYEGKLQLEGLEFRLQAPNAKYKALSVATFFGNGQCQFKNCVVTLDPGKFDAALAVASIADAGVVMKTDAGSPSRTQPRLALENCVVRGSGDLVCDRAGRPFEFEAHNVLAVLAGNVLNLELTAELGTTTPIVTATLANVTAYQTGYFIRMHGSKELKTLPPIKRASDHCLFVAAATPGRPLIHLEGPETGEDKLHDKMALWTGEGNTYANFSEMVDQRPNTGDEMPQPSIMSEKWKTFTGETATKVLRSVKFERSPGADDPFTRVAPGHFKTLELNGCGADISTLPKPTLIGPDME